MAGAKFKHLINWLIVATILIGSLLIIRVIDLQIVRGAFYRQISEENRQFRLSIPAERGVFLDRFGEPLAMNTRQYVRLTNPDQLYSPVEPISASEALINQVTNPLSVSYSLQRQYQRPLSMAHVLGYTSLVNETDLANDSTLGLTDAVGRLGLEQQYDQLLRGRDGYQEFEVNALGEKQAIQREQPPTVGRSLTTTLDPYLSNVAWQAMDGKTGAVVILDAETGEVLTLLSAPSFDSNLFASTAGTEDQQRTAALQQALADERQLFFNRAVSGQYPPGSIFKLVTAAAGLDKGAFNLETTVDDQGVLTVGEQSFANWYYTQYGRVEGTISLVRAIARSNDIFFYHAAEWTGVDDLVQKARDFGFGKATGIEIPGEKAGLVPDPAWKEQTLGERWFLGNTYHLGIGQGDLLVTPLQLARMVAVFGNDGELCQPTLIGGESRQIAGVNCGSLGLVAENLTAIQEGMIGACSAGGTAFPFFDWNTQRLEQLPTDLSPAESVRQGIAACKTGTAEFGGENELGHRRTHAWFGLVVGVNELLKPLLTQEPAEQSTFEATESASINEDGLSLAAEHQAWLAKIKERGFPKTLAILVLVESDDVQPFMEGSRDAAPVARQILDWVVGQ